MIAILRNEFAIFALAVQFLTRAPIPVGDAYTADRMAASVRYYPLVGAFVGLASAGVFWAAHLIFPALIALILAIAAGLLVTGAFHEDGLADTFDGIGGGQSRERALEIMRDSRLGTYGVSALVAALALKTAALSALSPIAVFGGFILAHGLSRLSSVLVIATSSYVRGEGAGKPVASGASKSDLFIALASSVALTPIGLWALSPAGLAAGILGLIVGHALMRVFFEGKLGGYTGDALGAVQQSSEIGFYLGVAAWLSP